MHPGGLLPAGAMVRSLWSSVHLTGLGAMLGPLAFLGAFLFLGGLAETRLEQPALIMKRTGSSAILSCRARTKVSYIHWYRHQEGKAVQRLLIVALYRSYVQTDSILKGDKVMAKRGTDGSSCNLLLQKLEKSDEGVYYCAAWEGSYWTWNGYGWKNHKVFGPGTLLRVTDKRPDEDTSPKPTISLPSVAERKLHKAGTYLCLLEDFFPDVIKIDWKEKNGRAILKSQQGNTMKTKDTYMKYTWLTVSEESMGKEHKCVIRHEKNKGGVDQEILFPSINTDLVAATGSEVDIHGHLETTRNTRVVTVNPWSSLYSSPFSRAIDLTVINSTKASLKDENDPLQLQLVNTSAYCTYLLFLVKSMVYTVITAIHLLGRAALCDNGKSS
ncbi:immunoglobulin lambda-1 light chain-like [Neofelis nebulosa]|uniref:immunoglobulin lambda-1 light chain-like n=1 Tax=Neofelis nebulosa TaxID=61452 RepID=UPI002729F6F6|nr:immunoglobulin lambda-1 light chain-like [Neofelis nebulosa]